MLHPELLEHRHALRVIANVCVDQLGFAPRLGALELDGGDKNTGLAAGAERVVGAAGHVFVCGLSGEAEAAEARIAEARQQGTSGVIHKGLVTLLITTEADGTWLQFVFLL